LPQRLHILSPGSTEDFLLVPLHCSRGYIFSPLEALRTFTGASTLLQRLHLLSPGSTEDFYSFSPALAYDEEVF